MQIKSKCDTLMSKLV